MEHKNYCDDFRTQETGIVAGVTEAWLDGELVDGTSIMGMDSVRTAPISS